MVRKNLGIIGISLVNPFSNSGDTNVVSLSQGIRRAPFLCTDTIDDLHSGEYRLEDLIGIIKDSFKIIIANKLSVITS